MKVAFLLPHYPWQPVGGFRVVYEYANGLVERGHEVSVIHPRRIPGGLKRPKTLRARLGLAKASLFPPRPTWHRIDPRVEMLYVPALSARYIPGADVVIATSWETSEVALNLGTEFGAKLSLIQHFEDWDCPRDRLEAIWRAPHPKILIAQWLVDKGRALGIPEHELIYIPNGLDHELYRLLRPIRGREPIVAMMYSPIPWKRSHDAIAVLAAAREKVSGLSAIFYGSAPRPDGLPEWISYHEKPTNDKIVRDIYNRAAVYLCVSPAEGWHLPPAEALACGCALVSTDIGGVRDYAEHGKTALLAPVGDLVGLAAATTVLLESREQRAKIASAGRARILQFEWSAALDRLDVLLKEVARVAPA